MSLFDFMKLHWKDRTKKEYLGAYVILHVALYVFVIGIAFFISGVSSAVFTEEGQMICMGSWALLFLLLFLISQLKFRFQMLREGID